MTSLKKTYTQPSFDLNELKSISPPWIHKVDLFNVIESTNTYLKKLSPGEPTLVVAHHQSAGRGTHERLFYCAPNQGLYVSFSVHEKLEYPISLVIGASILNALLDFGFRPHIKWVNDILIQNKKVGGVLCESFPNGIIVGFGLNHSVTSFPNELQDIAGSLHEFSDEDIDPLALCASILNHFTIHMKHPRLVQHRINQHLLHHLKKVNITHHNKTFVGILEGVNEDGHLVLNTRQGNIIFNTTVESIELNHE
jgi:BirA family transcriptional regulator, biotin operon repressor / biotin---[acetyl-CoA-carboxylase] ligase